MQNDYPKLLETVLEWLGDLFSYVNQPWFVYQILIIAAVYGAAKMLGARIESNRDWRWVHAPSGVTQACCFVSLYTGVDCLSIPNSVSPSYISCSGPIRRNWLRPGIQTRGAQRFRTVLNEDNA